MPELPQFAKSASYVEDRIHKALLAERPQRDAERVGVLGFSQIGKCARMLWAGIHGIENEREFDGRMLVLFDLGEAIEAHLIDLLERAGFEVRYHDPETDEQFEVTDFNGRAKGHLDGEILLGSKPHEKHWAVLETKSAKLSKYEELLEAGSYTRWNPTYGDQVQMYMGYRKREETLVLVECKDDSRIYSERIPFDPSRYGTLYQKAKHIVSTQTPPDKPEEATSQYCKHCKWCDVAEWCWGPLAEVSFDA